MRYNESATVLMKRMKDFKILLALASSIPESVAFLCNVKSGVNHGILNVLPFKIGMAKKSVPDEDPIPKPNLTRIPVLTEDEESLNHESKDEGGDGDDIKTLGTQLQTFNASRYIGNAGLCGRPLPNKCPGDEDLGVPPVGESDGDGESTDELQRWFYIGGATGFASAFWIACSVLLFNRRLRHAFFHFHNCLKDWVLSYNKFTRTIPISIGSLTKLTNLSLHGNNFSGVIPKSIGSLTKLTTLSLNGNNFSGVIPRSIGSLTKLTALSLHGNNFSGVIPRSIGSLTKLTTLSLHGNNFSGVIPRSIGSLTKLTTLRLHGKNFSGVIPRSIGSLTKLTFSFRLTIN
nr:leucine-rich repeat domain, L domain-like protein [Tanacetum cinerariifolium]